MVMGIVPLPKDIMNCVMRRREINARLMSDYEKALGKYLAPVYISGMRQAVTTQVQAQGRVIVQIAETSIEDILNWMDDKAFPTWRVKVVRDPNGLMRGVKGPRINGASYEIGFSHSFGPYHQLSQHIESFGRMN